MFPLLCYLLLPLPVFLSSPDCSGFFSAENACNSLVLEMAQDLPKYKPFFTKEAAGRLTHTCMKALDCTKSLECPEKNSIISEKIKYLAETCSGLWAFEGSFGDCLLTIRSNDHSEEYPCLKYWNNPIDAPSCEFFTADYDCAEMIVENKCGRNALEGMKRNLGFIKKHFGCDAPRNRFSMKFSQ